MSFIRVRSANPADPQHEFDAPARVVAAHPERYVVIDWTAVNAPRPPKTTIEPVVPVEPVADDVEWVLPAPVVTRATRRKK